MSGYLSDLLFLLGDARRRALWVMGLMVAASALDLCGIGLVWPYVAILSQPEVLDRLPLWETLKDAFGIADNRQATTVLGLLIVAIFYAKATVHYRIHRRIVGFATDHYQATVGRLVELYERTPYEYFAGRSTALLTKQLYQAEVFALLALVPALRLCAEGVVALSVILLLAFIDVTAVLVLMAIMGLLLWAYERRVRGRVSRLGQDHARAKTSMIAQVAHLGDTLKELRVFGAEGYFLERVRARARVIAATSAEHGVIRFLPRYVVDSAMITFVVLVATAATWSGDQADTILATLGVFGAAGARLIPSVNQIAANATELRFARSPTRELREAVTELATHHPASGTPVATPEPEVFSSLTLAGVSFHYAGADGPALQDIDLSISSGDTVGIIGASGAGKTTLIDVILGLLHPQTGELRVNGLRLGDQLSSWHGLVAYLPQDAHLVDGTLRDNVALGRPPSEVADEAVWRALEQAHLAADVRTLSNGLDSQVGEQGRHLSGGQRARVALARAFYFGRQVFVLDEATASLDQDTEAEIVAEIQRLKGEKTLIVIAHRLSTVRHCDIIYRLERGRVVECGSYSEVVGDPRSVPSIASRTGTDGEGRG